MSIDFSAAQQQHLINKENDKNRRSRELQIPFRARTTAWPTNKTSVTLTQFRASTKTSISETATVASQESKKTPSSKRFPAFGTLEFNRTCSWAMLDHDITAGTPNNNTTFNCTIWAQPPPNYNEGISAWVSLITSGFVMAKQTACSLRFSYAPGINLSEIIIPRKGGLGWTVPPNSTICHEEPQQQQQLDNCYRAQYAYARGGGPDFSHVQPIVAAIPPFRSPHVPIVPRHEMELKRTLGPDFHIETTMACATGYLFQLSTSIIKYQPNLYTTILPTLWDSSSLVLSLYIRTGHTEALHIAERTEKYRAMAEPIVQCALHLEQILQLPQHQQHEYASTTGGADHTKKVVWMLVTDSPYVKQFVTETFSTNRTDATIIPVSTKNASSASSKLFTITRTILVTRARGAHSKVRTSPSTPDVAEAFLDWYLIGESDVVISDYYAPSFGDTASYRTARPHYKVPKGFNSSNSIGYDVCQLVEPSMEYKGF